MGTFTGYKQKGTDLKHLRKQLPRPGEVLMTVVCRSVTRPTRRLNVEQRGVNGHAPPCCLSVWPILKI
jgi:hypothetical protein